MTRYPLQSALDLRIREEQSAAARLAEATRDVRAVEADEARLMENVDRARNAAHAATAMVTATAAAGAEGSAFSPALMAAAGFAQRRRDELAQTQSIHREFRRTTLARVRAAETETRQQYAIARQRREVLEKHAAKHLAEARVNVERRAEETLEEITRAIRHGQDRRRG